MKKQMSYVLLGTTLLALTAHGTASHCGDGNNRVVATSENETVFYAGNSNDFVVTRESETRVSIEDKVQCRFGTDSLNGFESIRFLDKTITLENVVIESAANQLTESLLSIFLAEQFQKLFGGSSLANTGEDTADDTRVVAADTVATINSGFGVGTFSNSNQNRPVFGATNVASSQNPVFTNTNFTTEPQINTNPVFTPTVNQNVSFQPTSFQPTVSSQAGFNNPFDLFGAQSTQQVAQSNTASAVVAWDPLRVVSGQSVYFESRDAANRHHFLGSAAGFVGSAEITIPNSFANQNSMTVYIKSGTSVVGTYNIALR